MFRHQNISYQYPMRGRHDDYRRRSCVLTLKQASNRQSLCTSCSEEGHRVLSETLVENRKMRWFPEVCLLKLTRVDNENRKTRSKLRHAVIPYLLEDVMNKEKVFKSRAILRIYMFILFLFFRDIRSSVFHVMRY